MDEQNNTNPPTAGSSSQQPVNTQTQPVQTPPPQPQQATPPQSFSNIPSTPRTNSAKKIILLVIGAFLLVIGAIFIFLVLQNLQSARSRSVSDAFVVTLQKGTEEEIRALAEGDASTEEFFLGISEDIAGDGFELNASNTEESTHYYLYDLSGASVSQIRTHVEEVDGSWEVTGAFVGDNLRLVPGNGSADQETAAEQPESAQSPQPASTTLSCLAQDDYKWMNFNKEPDTVTYDDTYVADQTFNKTANMFFKPDSTNEDSFLSFYDDLADFAEKNKDKQWKFRLEGSTYGSDTAAAVSKQLADERANKVRSQLESRGVPADRIVIDEPHDYGNETQDESKDQIYRRVQVLVDPTCDGSPNTSSQSGR